MAAEYDVAVIGAGILGLAVARALTERLRFVDLCVIEKEDRVGFHQTGHNSGVLHSGLYYAPGSLKAELCVRGRRAMTEFCEAEGLPLRRCGKVVTAVKEEELPRLEELRRRALANGLSGVRLLKGEELREVEPHAAGLEGLHVPETSVVDFRAVAERLAEALAGDVLLSSPLENVKASGDGSKVRLTAGGRSVSARLLVNCAGLHSDRVARLAGLEPSARILPFRGEYYRLSERAAPLVRGLIYPVPDPAFPFLGVHFTRRIDDVVEVGPNAVAALGREYYRGSRPVLADVREMLSYGGFWRLAGRHWRAGAAEVLRSCSRRLYARSARVLLPEVKRDDLLPAGAGVRAQAVRPDGRLVDDFLIEHSPGCIHVLNAPSPAATASLAIGKHIAALAASRL